MIYKKFILFVIAFIYMLSGVGLASDTLATQESVKIRQNTNQLEYFWLAASSAEAPASLDKLYHYKDSFLEPVVFYTFDAPVSAYDVNLDTNKYSFIYSLNEDKGIELIWSNDFGKTFSYPISISNTGTNPTLVVSEKSILVLWEDKGILQYKISENNGLSFSKAESLIITGESLSTPNLIIDKDNNIHLCFLAEENDTGLNKIMYTAWATFEPRSIFTSFDKLINAGLVPSDNAMVAFCQKEYLGRRQTYLSVSLDSGQSFGKENQLDYQKELLGLVWLNTELAIVRKLLAEDSFLHFNNKTGLLVEKLNLPKLDPPVITFPQAGAMMNNSSFEVEYDAFIPQPFVCLVEISSDETFNNSLVYSLPYDLKDGEYYLRAKIDSGINKSQYSDIIKFSIDTTAPVISSIESNVLSKIATIKGIIDDPAAVLTINNSPISLEAKAFIAAISIEAGENLVEIVAADEAGNTTILTCEVLFNEEVPEIVLLEPTETDWFKPDSVIVIQAEVVDLQSDIDEESEALVYIDNVLLKETLSYDTEDNSLFGLITLPPNLTDGRHSGKIVFSDKQGNRGQASFSLNIDATPPLIIDEGRNVYYSNSQDTMIVPVTDAGAGVDPNGIRISILGISVEGYATHEANTLILTSETALLEGTYEAEISIRDKAGNFSQTWAFSFVIDVTPPQIIIESSLEARTNKNSTLIQMDIIEDYPHEVKIYNNREEIGCFSLTGSSFSKYINLVPGNNEIEVVVYDKAGNIAAATFSTFADITVQKSGLLIENCSHGPNPFSPQNNLAGAFSTEGKGMVFSYALAKPADVKILIYDITGTIIWRYESAAQPAGAAATAWNGVNIFGQTASNGLYPYIFSASSGGLREIKKGKIIVIR